MEFSRSLSGTALSTTSKEQQSVKYFIRSFEVDMPLSLTLEYARMKESFGNIFTLNRIESMHSHIMMKTYLQTIHSDISLFSMILIILFI